MGLGNALISSNRPRNTQQKKARFIETGKGAVAGEAAESDAISVAFPHPKDYADSGLQHQQLCPATTCTTGSHLESTWKPVSKDSIIALTRYDGAGVNPFQSNGEICACLAS